MIVTALYDVLLPPLLEVSVQVRVNVKVDRGVNTFAGNLRLTLNEDDREETGSRTIESKVIDPSLTLQRDVQGESN